MHPCCTLCTQALIDYCVFRFHLNYYKNLYAHLKSSELESIAINISYHESILIYLRREEKNFISYQSFQPCVLVFSRIFMKKYSSSILIEQAICTKVINILLINLMFIFNNSAKIWNCRELLYSEWTECATNVLPVDDRLLIVI